MTDVEWKECIHCDTSYPTTEFWKDKGKLDGLHSYCKICSREQSRAWMAKSRKEEPARWAAQYRRDRRAFAKNKAIIVKTGP